MMKAALIQMPVTEHKGQNLDYAASQVRQSAQEGAQLVVLPEMFMCPYQNKWFVRFAEAREGETWQAMAQMARQSGVWLVGGSVPEAEDGRIYNTSYVFDPQGRQVARHRKVHLFDIHIEGGQRFKESDTFSAGDSITVFDMEGVTVGVIVCFDIRFPELARLTALAGAKVLAVPGAFNMTTGPLHWELAFRQRAVDNQLFTLGVSPARDESGPYVAYGNSMACSPWGRVLGRLGAEAGRLMVDLPLEEVDAVREQLPLLKARRTDVYRLEPIIK